MILWSSEEEKGMEQVHCFLTFFCVGAHTQEKKFLTLLNYEDAHWEKLQMMIFLNWKITNFNLKNCVNFCFAYLDA